MATDVQKDHGQIVLLCKNLCMRFIQTKNDSLGLFFLKGDAVILRFLTVSEGMV